jgi:hypothetical protein
VFSPDFARKTRKKSAPIRPIRVIRVRFFVIAGPRLPWQALYQKIHRGLCVSAVDFLMFFFVFSASP